MCRVVVAMAMSEGCVTCNRDVVIARVWMRRITHIWMPAELLEHRIVKVTGVAHEGTGNVVRMLHALHDIVNKGHARSLTQLKLPRFGLNMQVVDPRVMGGGSMSLDMVLELDNVAVGYMLCVYALQYWCFFDRADAKR